VKSKNLRVPSFEVAIRIHGCFEAEAFLANHKSTFLLGYHLGRMKLFAFLCLVTLSQAAIEFTRSIAAIGPGDGGTVTLAHGCTQTDKYGSNDCTLDWNSNNTVSLNVTLAQVRQLDKISF
jgi:hypothetical protein